MPSRAAPTSNVRFARTATGEPAASSPSPAGISASASAPEHRGDQVRPLRRRSAVARMPSSPASRRTRTASRRGGARGTSLREPRHRRRRQGLGPWSARSAGRTKSRKVTTADTGLPGRPNTSVPPARAEPDGLARLQRDAPEALLHAERRQRGLDVVVRADRHAARDGDHVRLVERARQDRLGGLAIVGHRLAAHHLAAVPRGQRGQRDGVAVVDLARSQAGPGATSSSPVASIATRGRRAHGRSPRPAATAMASSAGPSTVPAISARAPARRSSPASRMLACGAASASRTTAPSRLLHALDGDHGVGAGGYGGSGRDADRLAVAERRRSPGARPATRRPRAARAPRDRPARRSRPSRSWRSPGHRPAP